MAKKERHPESTRNNIDGSNSIRDISKLETGVKLAREAIELGTIYPRTASMATRPFLISPAR